MKHIYCSIVVFLCFLVSCAQMPKESNESKDVDIVYRTYHIDSKSITRPSSFFYLEGCAKYHGQYFCLFCESPIDKKGKSYYHLIVIQPSDSTVSEISKTERKHIEFKSCRAYDYPQMCVRNDSLLIAGYDAGEGGYKYHCIIDSICGDDGSSCWKLKEIPQPSSVVFEDDEYSVKFSNYREWGRYMSFIDKSDLKEHIYNGWGKVFKRQDGYYLCSNAAICRIANPKEGLVHTGVTNFDDYIVETGYVNAPASDLEILFYPSDPDILLNAFFMHNDTIYMLETYKDSTYLSKYDGQGILRVKGLEQKISYIFSSSLGKDFIGYGDTFNFVNETEDGEEHYGIIDIDGNQMTIINLVTNQPSGNNYDIDKMIEKNKRKEPVKYMFLSKSALEKISNFFISTGL